MSGLCQVFENPVKPASISIYVAKFIAVVWSGCHPFEIHTDVTYVNRFNLQSRMLLAVVVLFSQSLAQSIITVNNCPLATIICTVHPYDDNVTGGTTQYCHVDNCTVKIIKTGNVLDIVYLDDQFIVVACSKTDSIIHQTAIWGPALKQTQPLLLLLKKYCLFHF